MEMLQRMLLVAGLLAVAAPTARGQRAALDPEVAKPFLGVWRIEMTEPPEFKGTQTIQAGERHADLGRRVGDGGWRHDEDRFDAGTKFYDQAWRGESPEVNLRSADPPRATSAA